MTKKTIVTNSFELGVSADLDETKGSNKILTNGHNISLVARDKQLTVQKENGVGLLNADYPENLTPLAVKEINDVAYIVSADTAGNTELGTYPSPDFDYMTQEVGNVTLLTTEQSDASIEISEVHIGAFDSVHQRPPYVKVTVCNTSTRFAADILIRTNKAKKLRNAAFGVPLYTIQRIEPDDCVNFYFSPSALLGDYEEVELQAVISAKYDTVAGGSVVFEEPYVIATQTAGSSFRFLPTVKLHTCEINASSKHPNTCEQTHAIPHAPETASNTPKIDLWNNGSGYVDMDGECATHENDMGADHVIEFKFYGLDGAEIHYPTISDGTYTASGTWFNVRHADKSVAGNTDRERLEKSWVRGTCTGDGPWITSYHKNLFINGLKFVLFITEEKNKDVTDIYGSFYYLRVVLSDTTSPEDGSKYGAISFAMRYADCVEPYDLNYYTEYPASDEMLSSIPVALPTLRTYNITVTPPLEPATFVTTSITSSADNNHLTLSPGINLAGTLPLESGVTPLIMTNEGESAISSFLITASAGAINYDGIYAQYNSKNEYNAVYKYAAIRNFGLEAFQLPEQYSDPFITNTFGYTKNSAITLELQQTYDGTINMIMTDGVGTPRIVNSRTLFFTDASDAFKAKLVIRNNNSLSNVYSDESMDTSRLIPTIGAMTPLLTFGGVQSNAGILPGGGYKYYFKLLTDDEAETNVIEESRLVSVHEGTKFGSSFSITDGKPSSNAVSFTISNLYNKAFKSCSVYFTVSSGATDNTALTVFKITEPYSIDINTGICEILHSGYELTEQVDITDVQVGYSQISTAKTLTQKNNKLLLANTQVKNTRAEILQRAALYVYPTTSLKAFTKDGKDFRVYQSYEDPIDHEDTYADPSNIYERVGYIPGESYEIAVNFVFDSGAVSDAYPIQGIDFTRATTVDSSLLGVPTRSFVPNTGQNARGVVRTKQTSLTQDAGRDFFSIYTIELNTSAIFSAGSSTVPNFKEELRALGVVSFFISRRSRMKDMLMEGIMTATAAVPAQTNSKTSFAWSNTGVNIGAVREATKKVIIPAPCHTMEYSTEGTDGDEVPADIKTIAPILGGITRNFAFYSPDITMDTAGTAALFNDTTAYGIQADIAPGSPDAKITGYTTSKGYNGNVMVDSYRITDIHNASTNAEVEEDRIERPILSFVDDSFRSYAAGSFSGRSDRQLALTVTYDNEIETVDGAPVDGIFKDDNTEEGQWSVTGATPWRKALKSNVRFSPYIGVTTTQNEPGVQNRLAFPAVNDCGGSCKGYCSAYKHENYNAQSSGARLSDVLEDMVLGVFSRIYTSSYGAMLKIKDWERRYSNASSGNYRAISARIPSGGASTTTLTLQGGDAYAGFYYQQVWRPGGVNGIPTAASPADYTDGREGTGLTNSGLVIAFPVRSATNFALRGREFGEPIEDKLEVSNRKYMHYDIAHSAPGNRRREPAGSNYGNFSDNSLTTKVQYDPSIPYTATQQNNRVYVSESNITSEFKNGYRSFKGFNFRDYDSDLGTITSIISSGLYTYIVYRNGVSYIEILERAAMSTAGESDVFIGNSAVLAEKTTTVLPFLGSQHQRSVIATEAGVFGIDVDRRRIWQVDGVTPIIISENRVQKIIDPWFTSALITVVSSYKQVEKEAAFTFRYESGEEKTLIYNVKFKLWYGTSDVHHLFQFLIKDKQLALKAVSSSPIYGIHEQVKDLYTFNDDGIGVPDSLNSYFEFVVKAESLEPLLLNNLVINGAGIPSSIEVESESALKYEFGGLASDNSIGELIVDEPGKMSPMGIAQVADPYTIKIEYANLGDHQVGDIFTFHNIRHSALGVVHNYGDITGTITAITTHPSETHFPGDFTFSTKVFFPPSGYAGTAGLLLWDDYIYSRDTRSSRKSTACHTNVYMPLTFTSADIVTPYTFDVIGLSKQLLVGDLLTMGLDGVLVQAVVAKTETSGVVTTITTGDRITGSITDIFYGWKVPIRTSLMERYQGTTNITVPTPAVGKLISGETFSKGEAVANGYNKQPGGPWVKIRLNFDGIEPMYISSINSAISLSYS